MKLFKSFIRNASKPGNTFYGRLMLSGMNRGHNPMAVWCIDKYIKPHDQEDILDIGCGGGQNIANYLKRTQGKVCGIDYSSTSVEVSLRKNKRAVATKRAEIKEASVTSIPYSDAHFDVVSAFETIYFWPDIIACFREVKRVLKPGGRFVVCNEASRLEGNELWTKYLDMNIYSAEEIARFMKQAGFERVDTHLFGKSQRICVLGYL
ncbi:class I SAM-dependent methyltransferase [Porphyromonas pogonae]|uniref:class I SAM-dependent methyltransferase n=1 Tax=Porphyromonas pogonae TaxID=867595 RepID=UPI002E7633AC|nr:methyltransferase domain-containing protein [Porphyromonas pogonae]